MSILPYTVTSAPQAAVLRAILHVAATGQPVDPDRPRRSAAAVRRALDTAPSWYATDPAREDAAARLVDAFQRAVGACLQADDTASRAAQVSA